MIRTVLTTIAMLSSVAVGQIDVKALLDPERRVATARRAAAMFDQEQTRVLVPAAEILD